MRRWYWTSGEVVVDGLIDAGGAALTHYFSAVLSLVEAIAFPTNSVRRQRRQSGAVIAMTRSSKNTEM